MVSYLLHPYVSLAVCDRRFARDVFAHCWCGVNQARRVQFLVSKQLVGCILYRLDSTSFVACWAAVMWVVARQPTCVSRFASIVFAHWCSVNQPRRTCSFHFRSIFCTASIHCWNWLLIIPLYRYFCVGLRLCSRVLCCSSVKFFFVAK